MSGTLTTVEIRCEPDVVTARQRSRQIAELLGFDRQDQVRIATAVSEIARNAFRYAHGGEAIFRLRRIETAECLDIEVHDSGAGIPNLREVLDGQHESDAGLGMGLIGARRLMDYFDVDSTSAGTTIRFGKFIPMPGVEPLAELAERIAAELTRSNATNPFGEIQLQNRELLRAFAELQRRQSELSELNHELEETNRGVVALYAELDDKAHALQKASDQKTRFLSNMTHEFRTPLNSILSLSRMLLSEDDGPLGAEQQKQVRFINTAANDLSELVDDLLDIAKVEAGKVAVDISTFDVSELFVGLRSMLRPLAMNSAVTLAFEEPVDMPMMQSDQRKLAQILRNLISNALKYTEQGEVRVSARCAGHDVTFRVSDTGVGIAQEHLDLIFEEFYQVPGAHQLRTKGTGLGLPLCRRLAALLGGHVEVQSTPGKGSTFSAMFPLARARPSPVNNPAGASTPTMQIEALVIDDDELSRYVLREVLATLDVAVREASGGLPGLRSIKERPPHVIFLDLIMDDLGGFEVLDALKRDPATRGIPVILHSSKLFSTEEQRILAVDTIAVIPKNHARLEQSRALIAQAFSRAGLPVGPLPTKS